MNHLLGTVFVALIINENETDYIVQKEGFSFLLSKKEGEQRIGEAVEGFAYVNQKQQGRFTTHIPKIRVDHFGFGEVTDSRKDLGVFVSIGLVDKDVVVSLDDLPTMRELWPKKGDKVMISMKIDEKNRMWGLLAEENVFQAMSRKADETWKNKNITGICYRLKLAGSYMITDDYYLGFIHPSERDREPRLGEKVAGRVIGVRPDGVLNISLRPRAFEVISDDAAMILAVLERTQEKKIPYTDQSTPEEIMQYFGISKGQFKRAIGNLMKSGKVKQAGGFTYLCEK